jgi:hypothetical protein
VDHLRRTAGGAAGVVVALDEGDGKAAGGRVERDAAPVIPPPITTTSKTSFWRASRAAARVITISL